jgi:transcription antitermination factor NusG
MAAVQMPPIEAHWYAAQTRPRHEKRVAEHMTARRVECFLPLYESLRRWKDRRVRLALPLFPGYVFVRIPLAERLRVLDVSSVVRLVQFKGRPAPLPDDTMERLRKNLQGPLKAQPHPFLKSGHRVRVVRGSLEGMEGFLVRRKGLSRMVVSLDLIQRSICVEVDADVVEPLKAVRLLRIVGKSLRIKVESCKL